MARVTVEDCIEIVPNRFELVEMASQRVRQIASGTPLTIERDNDKDTIIALREIAEKTVCTKALGEEVIQSYQKYGKADKIDDNNALIGGGIEDMRADDIARDMADLQDDGDIEEDLENAGAFEFGDDEVINADD